MTLTSRYTKAALADMLLFLFASNHSGAQGFLKANGKLIVDGNGYKFILRGMSLGGWMLQEGYMFRLASFGQQHKIKAAIAYLVGSEKTGEFYNKWLQNHTRRVDIDLRVSWGFNSVRLPMHYNLYTKSIDKVSNL